MVAVTYAASAIVTGVLLVVVVLGLTSWADWRRGPPDAGGDGDGRSSERLLAVVAIAAVLIVIVGVALAVAGGGTGAGAGAGADGGGGDGDGGSGVQGLALVAFGAFFGLLLVGFLVWGVYSSARYRGLASAQAAGAGAWVLGMVLVVGITAALLFA
jgi:hypothetical protein